MKILVGCEESQRVTIEFRLLGHDAYSCDIQEESGGFPEWHIRHDLLEVIRWEKWDMLIAFPPCTDLARSGGHLWKYKRDRQEEAINFVKEIAKAKIDRIAIENPIGILTKRFREPDQIIEPWMFGHGETKATCLWLKNLPKLYPTCKVAGRESRIYKLGGKQQKERSKTYPGIAKAMAQQWSKLIPLQQELLF